MNVSKSVLNMCRVMIMYIGVAFERLFGGYDGVFITLIGFISVDYITGIFSAIATKKLSSRIGAIGIVKKLGILCVIALTTLMERNVFQTTTLRTAVILYYVSNEGISIIENCVKLGVPIPKEFKEALMSIGDEKDDSDT